MPNRPKVTVRGNLVTIQVHLGRPRASRHDRKTLVASTRGFQFAGCRHDGRELSLDVKVAQR